MNPIPNFWAYQAAFALQALAVALFVGYALMPRRGLSLAATLSLGAAAVLQTAFLFAWAALFLVALPDGPGALG
jgi:hypothetical protein